MGFASVLQHLNWEWCRNAKAWLGSLPTKMLETLIRPDAASNGPLLESQLQVDGKKWQSAGTVTLIGEDITLTAEADNCPSEETAQQQVALQLLHAYQTRLLQLFPTCTHLFLINSMVASRTSRIIK